MTPEDLPSRDWGSVRGQDPIDAGANVDLTTCDKEPIHLLGRIQSFGALIAISDDWTIARASDNVAAVIGRDANDLIGSSLRELLSPTGVEAIASMLGDMARRPGAHRMMDVALTRDGRRFDLALTQSNALTLIELEPFDTSRSDHDHLSALRPMIEAMRQAGSVQALLELAADHVHRVHGIDRVMMYRFRADMSGDVVVERRREGMERYEGMRFPASDIPKQARALYRTSTFRIIADTEDPGAAIVPARDPSGAPLDLSNALLRSVSPIHIEYMRNMGVRASMSLSLIVRGELWGLIACHHNSPLRMSAGQRTAAELFGQMLSAAIEQKIAEEERALIERSREMQVKVMAAVSEDGGLIGAMDVLRRFIDDIADNDGVVAYVNGQIHADPGTLTEEETRALVKFLSTSGRRAVFATDNLSAVHEKGLQHADRVAGLLAIPVSRSARDWLLVTRKPLSKTIVWGGNPNKLATVGPNGDRLQPRESFAAWKETVEGCSESWTSMELAAAEALRVMLLEVVLKMSDTIAKTRSEADTRQKLLIAELNHRVRNILSLVRSLVAQSASTDSPEEFAAAISGRVEALARAHSLVTAEHWSPTSLQTLLKAEIEAYDSAGESTRLKLRGPDVMLVPEAVTPVALALHELATNAVKYGALSSPNGHIVITTRTDSSGLVLVWAERGGPPVAPMRRRGTGSMLIEQSIPFDLGGEANVEMNPEGLTATFMIPREHLDSVIGEEEVEEPPSPEQPPALKDWTGKVLVVEDNLLVAMEMKKLIETHTKAEVLVCPNVPQAMKRLSDEEPAFAFLDINLKGTTSLEVAQKLRDMGVPFVFASGYGETPSVRESFPDTPVLPKPVASEDVRMLAMRMLGLDK